MHTNIFYSFPFCIDSKKWISHPQFENHVVGNRTDLNNEARKCGGLKRPAAHHVQLLNSSVVICTVEFRI